MKNAILGKDESTKQHQVPFEVKQALVAIELGQTDTAIFDYLKFFSSVVPVERKDFVHVIPDMSLLTSFYEKTEDAPFSKYELKAQLAFDLQTKIKHYFPQDTETSKCTILEGDPLEKLLENAREVQADLLFIGQDSEKSYHNILMKNLVRKTKGNAMVIPSSAAPTLNRMMVPIDFSDNSKKALETAIGINRQLENPVSIVCFHAYEMPNLSQYKIGRSLVSFQATIKANVAEALERFIENIDPEDRKHLQSQLMLKDLPGVGRTILQAAKENEADLVIMGVKGHSKVETLLMGSVAERFLTSNKSIPTLIVKG